MNHPQITGQDKNVSKKLKTAKDLPSLFINDYKLTGAKRRKLMEVLSIPTLYCREALAMEYVTKFCEQQGLAYITDNFGSVIVTKGQLGGKEYYPMVGAQLRYFN